MRSDYKSARTKDSHWQAVVLADLQSASIEYKHLKCDKIRVSGLQIPISDTVGLQIRPNEQGNLLNPRQIKACFNKIRLIRLIRGCIKFYL